MDSKECENLERALKRYKRKYERSQTLNELRNRKYFTKPSVLKREQKLKAIYRQQIVIGKVEL